MYAELLIRNRLSESVHLESICINDTSSILVSNVLSSDSGGDGDAARTADAGADGLTASPASIRASLPWNSSSSSSTNNIATDVNTANTATAITGGLESKAGSSESLTTSAPDCCFRGVLKPKHSRSYLMRIRLKASANEVERNNVVRVRSGSTY